MCESIAAQRTDVQNYTTRVAFTAVQYSISMSCKEGNALVLIPINVFSH